MFRYAQDRGPLKLTEMLEIIEEVPAINPLQQAQDLVEGWDEITEDNAFYDLVNILLLGGLEVTKLLVSFVTAIFTFIYDIYLYIRWLAPYLFSFNI